MEVHKYHEAKWSYETIKGLAGCVWCVDWSMTGNMLSVSSGDSSIAVYNVLNYLGDAKSNMGINVNRRRGSKLNG